MWQHELTESFFIRPGVKNCVVTSFELKDAICEVHNHYCQDDGDVHLVVVGGRCGARCNVLFFGGGVVMDGRRGKSGKCYKRGVGIKLVRINCIWV